jgi:hypothetical protein
MLQHFGYARQTPAVEPSLPRPLTVGEESITSASLGVPTAPGRLPPGPKIPGEDMEKIRIEQHTFAGGLWFAGWLFTVGFLHLSFWKGFLALVVWPYYLGVAVSTILQR